jgi:hypothetical protein
MYRLLSRRRLVDIEGPAGATRGEKVGACSMTEEARAGIQVAASLVRRCRLISCDECLCRVVIACAETPTGEE